MLSIEDATAAVAAVRAVGERAGVPIVINARTDVFLGGSGDPAEAVERANAYLSAGADCAFAIGLADRETIRAFVGAVDGPVSPARAPGRAERGRAPGTRRRCASIGPWAMRAASSLTRRIGRSCFGAAPTRRSPRSSRTPI